MTTRYEVQTRTRLDGWINTWHCFEQLAEHVFAVTVAETFATRKEAQAALDEYLIEVQAEIEAGQRKRTVDPADFRIAAVKAGAR